MSLVVLVATETRNLYQSDDSNNLVNSLDVDWRELVFGSVPLLLPTDEQTFKIHLGQVTATSLIFRLTPASSNNNNNSNNNTHMGHVSIQNGNSLSSKCSSSSRSNCPSSPSSFSSSSSSLSFRSNCPPFRKATSNSSAIIGISLLWQSPPRHPWHRLTCLLQRLKDNVEHALREQSSFLLGHVVDEFIRRQLQYENQLQLYYLMSSISSPVSRVTSSLSNNNNLNDKSYRWPRPSSLSSSIELLVSTLGLTFVADVLTSSLICYHRPKKQKLILSSVSSEQLLVHMLFVIQNVIQLSSKNASVNKNNVNQKTTQNCNIRQCNSHGNSEGLLDGRSLIYNNSFDNSTIVVDHVSASKNRNSGHSSTLNRCHKSVNCAKNNPCLATSVQVVDDESISSTLTTTGNYGCCGRSFSISPGNASASPSTTNNITSKTTSIHTNLLECINNNSVCALHVDHLFKVSLIDATSDNCCHESSSKVHPHSKLVNGYNSHSLASCATSGNNNCCNSNCCICTVNKSVTPICPKVTGKVPTSLSPSATLTNSKVACRNNTLFDHQLSHEMNESDEEDEEDSVFPNEKMVILDPVAVANQLVMREAVAAPACSASPGLIAPGEGGQCPMSAEEESLGYFSSFSSSQGSTAGNEVACTDDLMTLDSSNSVALLNDSTGNNGGNCGISNSSSGVSSSCSTTPEPISKYDGGTCQENTNQSSSSTSNVGTSDENCKVINSSKGFLREYRELRFNKAVPTPPPSPVSYCHIHDHNYTCYAGNNINEIDINEQLPVNSSSSSATTASATATTSSSSTASSSQSKKGEYSPALTLIPVKERDGFLQMYLQDNCSDTMSLLSNCPSHCSCKYQLTASNNGVKIGGRNTMDETCTLMSSTPVIINSSVSLNTTFAGDADLINMVPGQDYLQPHFVIQGVIRKKERDLSDLIAHLSKCTCKQYDRSDYLSQYQIADLDVESINPPLCCKNPSGGSIMQDTLTSILQFIKIGLPEKVVSSFSLVTSNLSFGLSPILILNLLLPFFLFTLVDH